MGQTKQLAITAHGTANSIKKWGGPYCYAVLLHSAGRHNDEGLFGLLYLGFAAWSQMCLCVSMLIYCQGFYDLLQTVVQDLDFKIVRLM